MVFCFIYFIVLDTIISNSIDVETTRVKQEVADEQEKWDKKAQEECIFFYCLCF